MTLSDWIREHERLSVMVRDLRRDRVRLRDQVDQLKRRLEEGSNHGQG